MSTDKELERLKRKKLQELQRRMLQTTSQQTTTQIKEPSNKEILNRFFVERAWEIWNIAYEQYPKLLPQVEEVLVKAIKDGKIAQKIDGANLINFLREIGIPVRLNTQIRFSEHGELKTLQQKLKSNE
ncbi:hypothetical protein JW865_08955 [Candidatus Bathyarchaeota archaeon]|nr:hypothetical protein [Candidatus Bathyarchaeota archaeon]